MGTVDGWEASREAWLSLEGDGAEADAGERGAGKLLFPGIILEPSANDSDSPSEFFSICLGGDWQAERVASFPPTPVLPVQIHQLLLVAYAA